MSVKVINVSSRIDVSKISKTSKNEHVKNVEHAFRTMSKTIGFDDDGDVKIVKKRANELEKKRGHVIADYDRKPCAALCVARDNVRGGDLVFSSRILPEAFTIAMKPGDFCIFRDVEVYQEPILPIDVDFDATLDIFFIRGVNFVHKKEPM